MHRITIYISLMLCVLLYTDNVAQATTQVEQLTHITPTTLDEQTVYPSSHVTIAPQPFHVLAWQEIKLDETLVHENIRIQIWDQDNQVIQQFGSQALHSAKVDISMIDATLYPSIRVVLFDKNQNFTLDVTHAVTFTYSDTYNSRLIIFIVFFLLLIIVLLILYFQSQLSLTDAVRQTLRPPDDAPMHQYLFGSLLGLSLFALALGSYTSVTHALYLIIKLPVLLYGALCISTLSAVALLTLLGSIYTTKTLLTLFARSLLYVSLLLGSFSPLILFYIYYPFSHDELLAITIVLFALAALGGVISFAHHLYKITQSHIKTILTIAVWIMIYGSVLLQLGWMLRPWVGVRDPVFHQVPFARPYSGNVFTEIIHTIQRL